MRSRSLVLLVATLLSSCASTTRVAGTVTPAELNASPDVYDGTTVTVYGYMRSEFENRAIWQSKDSRSSGNWQQDCVSLLIPEAMDTSSFNGAYVVVRGRFLRRLPPNVVSLGSCNITTLELLAPPESARSKVSGSWPNSSFKPKPLRGSA